MRLSQLPLGARVRDYKSDLVFITAAKDHYGQPGVTLLAERICTVACFDAAEPENIQNRVWDGYDRFGNNSYSKSNIYRWLNSESENWYTPSHSLDTPPEKSLIRYGEMPSDIRQGFMHEFSDTFKSCLLETDVPVLERREKNSGELTCVKAKFFLPSRTEIVKGDESGFAEGKPLPICYDPLFVHRIKPTERDMERYGRSWNPGRADAHLDAPQIYDPKYGWWYCLRTPNLQYGFLVRVMTTYGALSYTYANNDVVGIRPVCNLSPDTEVLLSEELHREKHGVVRRLYMLKEPD